MNSDKEFRLHLRKKMTKKEYKSFCRKGRSLVSVGINTGTRTIKSSKDYNRQSQKAEIKKMYP